ncbi:MAG: hypothetical protein M1144_01855 [Candidatus Thermoplasmatota archaeon]|jgi:flagellin-like protein|nr:hypothetical protein [Candidatus Thermoplasmatota archaeon]MCL5984028.1 hypothetical protein [Candidatus Thermoplasmatota archaeon]
MRRVLRRRLRLRRAVTPIIATILLLALTIVAAGVLYASLTLNLPPQATNLYYSVGTPFQEPAYGDGSDCTLNKTTGQEMCQSIPAVRILITGTVPSNGIPTSSVTFVFQCNGTTYLRGTLQAITWVPGSSSPVPSTAPQLGMCGSFVPPKASFNRLAFFQQLTPGSPVIHVGDSIVFFVGTIPGDDDFHGAPSWCFTSGDSACTIILIGPSGPVATIPIENFL